LGNNRNIANEYIQGVRQNRSHDLTTNGSVGSIADLIPKGPGFESQISHGFFPHVKEVEDIGLTNRKEKQICLEIPKGEALTRNCCCASICLLRQN
jgi:hypothetical protein